MGEVLALIDLIKNQVCQIYICLSSLLTIGPKVRCSARVFINLLTVIQLPQKARINWYHDQYCQGSISFINYNRMEENKGKYQIFLHTFMLLTSFISVAHFTVQTTMYEFIVLFLHLCAEYGSCKVVFIGVKFSVLTLNICKSHFVQLSISFAAFISPGGLILSHT